MAHIKGPTTRECGFVIGRNQHCTHDVNELNAEGGFVRCSANHLTAVRLIPAAPAPTSGPAATSVAGTAFGLDDLVGPGASPSPVAVPPAEREQLARDLGALGTNPSAISPSEFTEWVRSGAHSAEVVNSLRSQMIRPQEVTGLIDVDGEYLSMIEAIERGHVAPYDAAVVVSTYPGTGWSFDADRFAWSKTVPLNALANKWFSPLDAATRQFPTDVLRDEIVPTVAKFASVDRYRATHDVGDAAPADVERWAQSEFVSARFAAELNRQSSAFMGIDLDVRPGPATPDGSVEPGWDAGLPDALIESCNAALLNALRDPDDDLHAYAAQMLYGDALTVGRPGSMTPEEVEAQNRAMAGLAPLQEWADRELPFA